MEQRNGLTEVDFARAALPCPEYLIDHVLNTSKKGGLKAISDKGQSDKEFLSEVHKLWSVGFFLSK